MFRGCRWSWRPCLPKPLKACHYPYDAPVASVFIIRVPLVKNLPSRSRVEVGRPLATLIWDYALTAPCKRDQNAHLNLLTFVRCVLRAMPLRKKRLHCASGPESLNSIMRFRGSQWLAGEQHLMWNEVKIFGKEGQEKQHTAAQSFGPETPQSAPSHNPRATRSAW